MIKSKKSQDFTFLKYFFLGFLLAVLSFISASPMPEGKIKPLTDETQVQLIVISRRAWAASNSSSTMR